MSRLSSHLATFLLGFLMLCGLTSPAHAQFVSQAQVLAAQQAALAAARTAASFAATAATFRAQANSFAQQAAAATNPRTRAALQSLARSWSAVASAWEAAARSWANLAQQALIAYQNLLRRFPDHHVPVPAQPAALLGEPQLTWHHPDRTRARARVV